ncbi:MAG: divergent polysaccharide deacetylase family protein [Pseudomonadota bacterium]
MFKGFVVGFGWGGIVAAVLTLMLSLSLTEPADPVVEDIAMPTLDGAAELAALPPVDVPTDTRLAPVEAEGAGVANAIDSPNTGGDQRPDPASDPTEIASEGRADTPATSQADPVDIADIETPDNVSGDTDRAAEIATDTTDLGRRDAPVPEAAVAPQSPDAGVDVATLPAPQVLNPAARGLTADDPVVVQVRLQDITAPNMPVAIDLQQDAPQPAFVPEYAAHVLDTPETPLSSAPNPAIWPARTAHSTLTLPTALADAAPEPGTQPRLGTEVPPVPGTASPVVASQVAGLNDPATADAPSASLSADTSALAATDPPGSLVPVAASSAPAVDDPAASPAITEAPDIVSPGRIEEASDLPRFAQAGPPVPLPQPPAPPPPAPPAPAPQSAMSQDLPDTPPAPAMQVPVPPISGGPEDAEIATPPQPIVRSPIVGNAGDATVGIGLPPVSRFGTGAATLPAPEAVAIPQPPRPALEAFAAATDPEDVRPRMAVILRDDPAQPIDADILNELPLPISFAVDPRAEAAADRAAAYRAAGFEVMIAAGDLAGDDFATRLDDALSALPETVAFLDNAASAIQGDRSALDTVLSAMEQSGHGLVAYPRGLNSAERSAARAGLSAATLFREIDAAQPPEEIGRILDRAAFTTVQSGSAIVVAPAGPEVIAALFSWALGERSESVALVPVSAVLQER